MLDVGYWRKISKENFQFMMVVGGLRERRKKEGRKIKGEIEKRGDRRREQTRKEGG